jgi:transposase-like protein
MNSLNLPALEDALEEISFFERDRTDAFVVELAIILYDSGVSLRKVQRVFGWLGTERSHVAIWNWIQKFGERLSATGRQPVAELPSTILLDETAVVQHGEQFVLFAALDPATREVVHLSVALSRNYLTTRRFLEEIEDLYSELPDTVITDGARGYGAAFGRLRIRHVVRVLGVRNRIGRCMQELKRRIDTFYASFTGNSVESTHNWLRQFTWFWNHCLS